MGVCVSVYFKDSLGWGLGLGLVLRLGLVIISF